ncbi:MAG: hypothetical protein DYG98_14800 [Haliscomenobacteraceae bacterium CHB4]|nr:hypothetical protein [Haliscomenobacteraceae bacterium CHB4]
MVRDIWAWAEMLKTLKINKKNKRGMGSCFYGAKFGRENGFKKSKIASMPMANYSLDTLYIT